MYLVNGSELKKGYHYAALSSKSASDKARQIFDLCPDFIKLFPRIIFSLTFGQMANSLWYYSERCSEGRTRSFSIIYSQSSWMNYIVWRQLLKVLVLSINRKLLRASRPSIAVWGTASIKCRFLLGFIRKYIFTVFVQMKYLFRPLFEVVEFSRVLSSYLKTLTF